MATTNENLKMKFTKNLKQFKFHDVNRKYDSPESLNRIARIKESMITNGVLPDPITVTSQFYVVDGQHRVQAAILAGLGIYFVIDPSIPNTAKGIFEAAMKFNRDAKVWSKVDYINGHAQMGKEDYKLLQMFAEKYPMFTPTEREMLLMNSGTTSMGKVDFAKGKFAVKSLKRAEYLAECLLSLKPYYGKEYRKSVFVRTLLTIMERNKEFKFEEFLYKVKKHPALLKPCGDKRQYSEMIEDIYNFRRRNNEKLNIRIK